MTRLGRAEQVALEHRHELVAEGGDVDGPVAGGVSTARSWTGVLLGVSRREGDVIGISGSE